jgi:hypothetical protein
VVIYTVRNRRIVDGAVFANLLDLAVALGIDWSRRRTEKRRPSLSARHVAVPLGEKHPAGNTTERSPSRNSRLAGETRRGTRGTPAAARPEQTGVIEVE